jgi:two-component system, chemotaxis family, sensor kinase CheA
LASEAELAWMSDSQIQEFIFQPGFSTAAQVTSVSGRGVGMDVVKTNIELIRGAIALDSVPGEGTRFVIKIPLTLAIVSALIVEAGRERFAIPQISVVELVRPGRNGSDGEGVIEQIKNTPVLRLGEQLLPLVSLAGLLGLEDQPEAEAEPPTIVVTRAGHGLLGIVVDQVFDPEKIAAKPVAPILRNITMFGGSTILGDGSVIMILDPDGVARASGITGGESHRSGEWQPMLLLGAGAAPARGTAGAGRESAKASPRYNRVMAVVG